MFNIGLPEIGIVLLVVVLAVKPENLPDFLRKMRKLYKTVKDTINGFRADLHKVETSLQAELDSLDEKEDNSIKQVSQKNKTKKIEDTSKEKQNTSDLASTKTDNKDSETDDVKDPSSIDDATTDDVKETNKESVGISADNWYD